MHAETILGGRYVQSIWKAIHGGETNDERMLAVVQAFVEGE